MKSKSVSFSPPASTSAPNQIKNQFSVNRHSLVMADNNSTGHSAAQIKKYTLKKDNELRFEVDFNSKITLKLLDGTAESFGVELAKDYPYVYSGVNSAIYSWHGCTIQIDGPCHAYVAEETPVLTYINTHAIIQDLREQARRDGKNGPRVMIVGAVDSGKSSLCSMLCNWAARQGEHVIYVDLDVGQGNVVVPGMLAAVPLDTPVEIHDLLGSSGALSYFYGHLSPGENPKLYKTQQQHLVKVIDRKLEIDKSDAASGLIINTCGWVEALGYELLLNSIETFAADLVLVIDHERLYNDLKVDILSKGLIKHTAVEIVKLTKSGGVVPRNAQFRSKTRMNRIREYFYGRHNDLSPHSIVFDFNDVLIYKVSGGSALPSAALPVGAESYSDPLRLVEVFPSSEFVHSIVAVSTATTSQQILESNVLGFIYITDVSMERRKITALSPTAGALPSKYLVLGNLKWLE